MQPEDRELLRELLTQQRVAAVAVLVENRPYVGLLPFAMRRDFRAALIHASTMARHSAGLQLQSTFGMLVQEPDQGKSNPQQLARVSLQGTVAPLDPSDETWASGKKIYLEKFPQAKITFELGDFNLYELLIEEARFVAGFGKTFDISPTELQALAAKNLAKEGTS